MASLSSRRRHPAAVRGDRTGVANHLGTKSGGGTRPRGVGRADKQAKMGAGQNGTGVQSSFGFRGRVPETGTRKERPLEGGSRPRGAREAGDLLEKCLLAPHCRERHRAMACEKFKGLSLPHR